MSRIALLLAASLALLATPVLSSPVLFHASLSGAAENPPNPSAGTGEAVVIFNAAADTMHISVFFSGLTGTTTASHIHCCTNPPGNVGVATESPSFSGFPLGVTAGTFDEIYDLADTATYHPNFLAANGGTAAGAESALLAGLLGGRAYLNIHSTFRGGGEIRGFFTVPEPASAALALAALGLAGLGRSRRQGQAAPA